MTRDEFEALQPGDIVKHVSGGKPHIVHGNYGDTVISAHVYHMMNPSEWDKVDTIGAVVSTDTKKPERDELGQQKSRVLYDVTVQNGKYRFVYFEGTLEPVAYRYGERWPVMTARMLGSNALMALVAEIAELREAIGRSAPM